MKPSKMNILSWLIGGVTGNIVGSLVKGTTEYLPMSIVLLLMAFAVNIFMSET